MSDDLLVFMDEDHGEFVPHIEKTKRKVLIVDDDDDMHAMTKLALKGLSFEKYQLEIIHAYSGVEAYKTLEEQSDIAVILLDVVMESEFAGLELVRKIRNELFFDKVRIILRTGQAGYAPELETIEQYDINDYRVKTELTRERLYGCIMTALRSHHQLEKLEKLAFHDELTKLYNRNGFLKSIGQHEINREKGNYLVLINIDQFALLNDHFGTKHGDDFLINFSFLLKENLNMISLARLGADQFALFLEITEAELLEKLVALKCELEVNGTIHQIQFHAGYSSWNPRATALEHLTHSTIALKKAKDSNSYEAVAFSEIMLKALHARSEMLTSLQQDFLKDKLFLVYQPQVDINTHRMIGVESLIRWQDPSGHMISPEVFIELAENSGLIIKLGEWILRKALNETKQFFQDHPHFRVGVNVSPIQFEQDNFIEIVESALKEQGVDGKNLNIEITESVGVVDSEEIKTKLQKLRMLGITISIDDFGTGYSNLSSIDNLNADCLKIDRSFVNKIDTKSGKSIIKMIIDLGSHLGMQVLAEGIETLEQHKKLSSYGCNEYQGYFLSQPLSLRQLEEWMIKDIKE
ncbi:EAL domain-containing response regulator [Marinomonas sp. PE14-40]|uniref:EAL domain-containing response regulator n=1 Tax=Marinomonas sp. PE14-40 TaxID=3060621 RepID=UPI003F67D1D3